MKRNNLVARDLSNSIAELNAKLLMLEQLRSKGYLALKFIRHKPMRSVQSWQSSRMSGRKSLIQRLPPCSRKSRN